MRFKSNVRSIIITHFFLLFHFFAEAHTLHFPAPPAAPTPEHLLQQHQLADYSSAELMYYLEENREFVGYSIESITLSENATLRSQYAQDSFQRDETPRGWPKLSETLTLKRENDPRRIVDSVIRTFAKKGDHKIVGKLLSLIESIERPWVRWKFYPVLI